jgi:hypothetical protein
MIWPEYTLELYAANYIFCEQNLLRNGHEIDAEVTEGGQDEKNA